MPLFIQERSLSVLEFTKANLTVKSLLGDFVVPRDHVF